MKKAGQLIQEANKIVIKIGSSSLTDRHGLADRRMMHSIVEQIVGLIKHNKQIIIVSSGAASSGVATSNNGTARMMFTTNKLCAPSDKLN